MSIWLLTVRPFKTFTNLYLNITNEIILIIIFAALFILNIAGPSDKIMAYSNEIGWALIALVSFAILQSWGFLLPIFYSTIRKKCSSKQGKEEKGKEEKKEELAGNDKIKTQITFTVS